VLARLLHNHRHDRTIVFTEDNATVHAISRRFLLPSITHQTRIKERSAILASFNAGEFTAVVTSKVLNEGVNVPEANVAIIFHIERQFVGPGTRPAPRTYFTKNPGKKRTPVRDRRGKHLRAASERPQARTRGVQVNPYDERAPTPGEKRLGNRIYGFAVR
jgi:superfamily II DNA or RNA helicase